MAQLFRCAGENHLSAFIATFRPHFYNMLSECNKLFIMLNSNDSITFFHQALCNFNNRIYILKCSPVVGSSKISSVFSWERPFPKK